MKIRMTSSRTQVPRCGLVLLYLFCYLTVTLFIKHFVMCFYEITSLKKGLATIVDRY